MQMALEKGKRMKPDQMRCVSSFVTCFSPTAQLQDSAQSTSFTRQGEKEAERPRQNKLVVCM